MASENNLVEEIRASAADLERLVGKAKYWHAEAQKQFESEYQACTAELEVQHNQTMAQTAAAYETDLAKIVAEEQAIAAAFDLEAAPWSDMARWQAWAPDPNANTAPEVVRLGNLSLAGAYDTLTLPALLPAMGDQAVLFSVAGAAKQTAAQAVQSVLLRLLAAMRPGNLHFTFLDPVGLGQNVATFMPLADFDDRLVNSRAWTEPRHIEQRLGDLTEHMENVIQGYLRNEFATIQEYNAQARVPEPYRLLVVFDFPTNFSEDAARRLVSIAQNGARCGVHAIVVYDTEKPLPHGFNIGDLARASTVIGLKNGRLVWQEQMFDRCKLELDRLPEFTVEQEDETVPFVNHVVKTVGAQAQDANRVEVPFGEIAPDKATWWQQSASDAISVALGPRGATAEQQIELGRGTAIHALVAGRTGSGKSTLLHVLITNAARPTNCSSTSSTSRRVSSSRPTRNTACPTRASSPSRASASSA